MNIVVAKHVPYEGPAMIAELLNQRGHTVESLALWDAATLPDSDMVDAWVSMGGPMSARDGNRLPWIAAEQRLLRRLHERRRPILGVCLGAQQIGACLGGDVTASPEREIGWYPVTISDAWRTFLPGASPPAVLHWHGEMVSPPPGSEPLGSTAGCPYQGFFFPDRPTVGLQFHLEMDGAALEAIIEASTEELDRYSGHRFVDGPATLRQGLSRHGDTTRAYLDRLLTAMGL